MAFEVSGKIIKILPVESKSATFQTREFVIEIPDGNYTQFVKFQLTQDRCGLVDAFKEGDSVKVSFNLRGRNGKESISPISMPGVLIRRAEALLLVLFLPK
jgi:single-strand DNA-binding protein